MDDRMWKYAKYSKREAWCWLIETANYEDYDDFIKGESVKIPRGSLVKTERQLAHKWKWGRQKVRTFLKTLEKDKKIILNLTQKLTQISIMNYNTYQESQPKNKPSDNPAITQQQPTTKERKEFKENKEVIEAILPRDISDLWNKICCQLKPVKLLSLDRENKIRTLIHHTLKTKDAWQEYFQMFSDSSFLRGESGNSFIATFDWALNPRNMVKVMDGNYEDRENEVFNPVKHMQKIIDEREAIENVN